MLSDGATVEAAMTGDDGALSTLPADAVWVQMSTVGAEWTQRLADLANGRVDFVDAPVSGSSVPAEHGELVVLASGAPQLRHRVQPLFDVVGRHTLWLDSLGDGSRLKLVLNNWLAVLVEGMAENLSLAAALGLDPALVTDTVEDSALSCAFAVAKGRAMIKGDYAPGFLLRHAHKDVGLAAEAADGHDAAVPLTEAILRRWSDAIAQGHGDDDVSAAINAVRPSRCS
jgi:3-hydroxyisobutyrate dehydrogenase